MQFFFETAEQYATPGNDPLWAEANTFPMIRVDIRDITPTQAADEVVQRVTDFFDAVESIWPSGKLKKYALTLIGPGGQDQTTCSR